MRTTCTAVLSALTLFGCATMPASEPPARHETRTLAQCDSNFEAEITSGPEAGFKLAGKLSLAPVGQDLTGTLKTDTATIPVAGTLNKQLVLTFKLADGRNIVGVGPAPANFCTGMVSGVAVGPSLDASFSLTSANTSAGHWLASSFVSQNLSYDFGLDASGRVITVSANGDILQNTIVPMDCVNRNTGNRTQTNCSDGSCSGLIQCLIEYFYISCSTAKTNCENLGGDFVLPETPNQS